MVFRFLYCNFAQNILPEARLYAVYNLVAQNKTFRIKKPSQQLQFCLPQTTQCCRSGSRSSERQNGPQYKKKLGQSCFEFAGLWFSLGRTEDFPEAWKPLTGASKEKKINFFLNSIFFNFYAKNMLFCTFWSTETLLLKTFRRIQHA